jgi:hypothetical protein
MKILIRSLFISKDNYSNCVKREFQFQQKIPTTRVNVMIRRYHVAREPFLGVMHQKQKDNG